MEISILHRQGVGIREIARSRGLSRNTVRRALRQEQPAHYGARPLRASKLDPYKDYLRGRVEAAQPAWLPATALYREIQACGYGGQLSILRAWLHTLKPPSCTEPLIRFETAPGEQMQVDWIVFRRGQDRLSAFVAEREHAIRGFCRRF